MERGVLGVATLVGEVLRRLVFRPDLDQLGLLRVVLPEVDAEPALSGLYLLHGNLRRFVRINRSALPIVATSVPRYRREAVSSAVWGSIEGGPTRCAIRFRSG